MGIRTQAGAALCVLGMLLAGGCNTDAVNRDARNTLLDSDDLVVMTDQMAAAIVSDPQVAQVTAVRPMVIVMKPIVNESSTIIRGNEKELYVHRVRVLLSSKPELRHRFVFVLNRADYEKLRAEEGYLPEQLGIAEERAEPEFALTGTFYTNTQVSSRSRTDTFLCTFRLTSIVTGLQLWEGSYETRKHVKKDFLD